MVAIVGLRNFRVAVVCAAVVAGGALPLQAQQTHVGVPFRNGSHSFYENVNVGWGMNAAGMSFRFNAPAPPPFGGFDPNAQSTVNGGFAGGNANGSFGLTAGQGSNTTFGSQTVSGTMMNGSTLVFG